MQIKKGVSKKARLRRPGFKFCKNKKQESYEARKVYYTALAVVNVTPRMIAG